MDCDASQGKQIQLPGMRKSKMYGQAKKPQKERHYAPGRNSNRNGQYGPTHKMVEDQKTGGCKKAGIT